MTDIKLFIILILVSLSISVSSQNSNSFKKISYKTKGRYFFEGAKDGVSKDSVVRVISLVNLNSIENDLTEMKSLDRRKRRFARTGIGIFATGLVFVGEGFLVSRSEDPGDHKMGIGQIYSGGFVCAAGISLEFFSLFYKSRSAKSLRNAIQSYNKYL